MSRINKHKYKIFMQTGEEIWQKPNNKKLKNINKNRRKIKNLSEYGIRLLSKQKLKKYYGNLTEKQFYKTYKHAKSYKGQVKDNLIILLERRIDTVVYRLNLAVTMFHARQIVSHGHILVNGKKVTIPSYKIKNKDLIQVKPKSRKYISNFIKNQIEIGNNLYIKEIPSYMEVNYNIMSGIFLYTPNIDEIPYKVDMNISKAIELYK